MTIISVVGVFNAAKDDWGQIIEPGMPWDNWQRLVNAHPELIGYHGKSYNVSLITPGQYVPPNDDAQRTESYNLWLGGDQQVANGQDLLRRGNYVHDTIQILSIDDGTQTYFPTGGKAYYAGDFDSFDLGAPDPIIRNYLEIVAFDDIAAAMSHTGSELVTVVFDDGQAPASAPVIDMINPPNGPTTGGTFVQLFGSGYTTPGFNLTWDGGPITYTVINDGQIDIASTPPHPPGTVMVTASNNVGTATTSFFYDAEPGPGLDMLSPDQEGKPKFGAGEKEKEKEKEKGTLITVTGRNFQGGGKDQIIMHGGVIGNQLLPTTFINFTTLQFYAPPSPFRNELGITIGGVATVCVKNNNGVSLPLPFTYL